MKTLLLLETYPSINKQFLGYFEKYGRTLKEISETYDPKTVEGIVIRTQSVDQKTIDSFPNLKHIFRIGVGTDNIDTTYCQKKGIEIQNTPGANSSAVADLALRGTLSLLRKINYKHGYKKRFMYMGNEISSQKIGFIGFGHIAKYIHQRLLSFGAKQFLVVDPYVDKKEINKHQGCEKIDSIEKMINKIDILYILLPKTSETTHSINAKLFVQAQPHLKVINTSRGGIVNEKDLYDFLKNNKQAGAFVDVRESEPTYNRQIKKLIKLPNCICTPHIGAMTHQAYEQMHKFKIDEK